MVFKVSIFVSLMFGLFWLEKKTLKVGIWADWPQTIKGSRVFAAVLFVLLCVVNTAVSFLLATWISETIYH